MTFAHGVGLPYQSPLPVWLYLVGAALAVLVSFVIRAFGSRDIRPTVERVVMGERGLERLGAVLRVMGLAIFGLIVLFAFVDPDPGFSVTPLLFWVLLVMATIVGSCILAGFWDRMDPWATIYGFYRYDENEEPSTGPPRWLGPVLVYGLFWFELVSRRGFDPVAILVILAAYTLFALTYRSSTNWRSVDPLSIVFGFAGQLAPLESRSNQGVVYRGPLAGLDRDEPMPWPFFISVLVLLASTTFDNLRETVEWTTFMESTGLDSVNTTLVDSVALAALTLPFLLTLLGAVALSRRWLPNDLSLWDASRRYAWTLIPIGIAYVLAHNTSLVIIGVPELISRVVDSLGSALFTGYVPSPQLVWGLSIALVVWGHVLGVLSSHRASLRITGDHRSAIRAHTALTLLMTLYTVATLWLLSLPLVANA